MRRRLVEAHERVAEIELALEAVGSATRPGGRTSPKPRAWQLEHQPRASRPASPARPTALARERRMRAERLAAARADRQRWAPDPQAQARPPRHARAVASTRPAPSWRQLPTCPPRSRSNASAWCSEIADADRQRQRPPTRWPQPTRPCARPQQSCARPKPRSPPSARPRARIEARVEAVRDARRRRGRTASRRPSDCEPDGLPRSGRASRRTPPLPALDDVERQLARLKADRERLGGVNLAADQELEAIGAQFDGMEPSASTSRKPIAKLRGAIQQLNREAKKRIDEAFQAVNAHFQSLFDDPVQRRRGAPGDDRGRGPARGRPGDHRQAARQEAGDVVLALWWRADADRPIAHFRRIPHQPVADLRPRRGRCTRSTIPTSTASPP